MDTARPQTPDNNPQDNPRRQKLAQALCDQYQAALELRRGACLLNAGQFDRAAEAFAAALRHGSPDTSLPGFLASALLADQKPAQAANVLRAHTVAPTDPVGRHIQRALLLRASGAAEEAVRTMRTAIEQHPESADLHFELGNLLCDLDRYDEAELRFTQAVTIDDTHAQAWVNLGLCCAVRGVPAMAVKHLQRAQLRCPDDARVALLLAHAARAAQQQGHSVRIQVGIAPVPADHRKAIADLSNVIESQPEFVDAFLSLPVAEESEDLFAMLLQTVELALERQPEHAELHYHCGRVLDRLGRKTQAIQENETAVTLDPKMTRALIELARLYRQTDRHADALSRLQQAIAAGAEYADVYCLLGHLYRDRGDVHNAKQAYRRALDINDHYHDAQEALATL